MPPTNSEDNFQVMDIPELMQAMVFERAGKPLVLKPMPVPKPSADQMLLKIQACGICRTDLHILDGELRNPKPQLIPGHEIIATVVKKGQNVTRFKEGDIVGVPWLAHTCGKCKFCKNGHENLCDNPLFTGYTVDGGFAEYTVAYEQYCFNLSNFYSNSSGAPLMCAGLIGYRSYKMLDKKVENIGIYGFGAAAHIIIQLAVFQKKKVYVFTRAGDKIGQKFAMDLGAEWAGDSEEMPPIKLDAAIIFAPLGDLIPKALQDVDKGSMVVCGGIHMTDIPSFPYHLLWEERSLHSVANLTREDGLEFLELAEKVPVRATTVLFKLQEANQAIDSLRHGKIHGAAVLVM